MMDEKNDEYEKRILAEGKRLVKIVKGEMVNVVSPGEMEMVHTFCLLSRNRTLCLRTSG